MQNLSKDSSLELPNDIRELLQYPKSCAILKGRGNLVFRCTGVKCLDTRSPLSVFCGWSSL
jgi:hypothetical protein